PAASARESKFRRSKNTPCASATFASSPFHAANTGSASTREKQKAIGHGKGSRRANAFKLVVASSGFCASERNTTPPISGEMAVVAALTVRSATSADSARAELSDPETAIERAMTTSERVTLRAFKASE